MTKKPTLELNPVAGAADAEAQPSNIVTDARGRTLKIVEPDVLTESRLVRMLGEDAAFNAAYMEAYVFPAVSVAEIDGEEEIFPTTQREVDALIQRLGREGIGAASLYRVNRRKADQKKAEEAAVKN